MQLEAGKARVPLGLSPPVSIRVFVRRHPAFSDEEPPLSAMHADVINVPRQEVQQLVRRGQTSRDYGQVFVFFDPGHKDGEASPAKSTTPYRARVNLVIERLPWPRPWP